MPAKSEPVYIGRVFHSSYDPSEQTTHTVTELSILDSYAASYSATGCLWFYDSGHDRSRWDPELLKCSLSATLEGYPHLTGRLRLVVRRERDAFSGEERLGHNRHEIWWGDSLSPGVRFIAATSPLRLDELVPTPEEQAKLTVWNPEELSKCGFLPDGAPPDGLGVPGADDPSRPDRPCMTVQITELRCGGHVLGILASHMLGDATALSIFAQDWSKTHSALASSDPAPPTTGTVDHGLVSRILNSGCSTYPSAAAAMSTAMSLPFHRYDWWSSASAPFRSAAMDVPSGLADDPLSTTLPPHAKTPPWADWDVAQPAGGRIVHFTPGQLSALRSRLDDFVGRNPTFASRRKPSTIDVALTHLWVCVNRARGFGQPSPPAPSTVDGTQVFADISVGLRARLKPALPPTYVGNALAIVTVRADETVAATGPDAMPPLAFAMRAALESVAGDALAAHLYALGRESTPARLWQTFLGHRHLLVTSWVQSGVHDVGFGVGADGRPLAPRLVFPVMPFIDGCVQLLEGTRKGAGVEGNEAEADGKERKWYDDGLDISVYLERKTLLRLEKDADLFPEAQLS